jgi:hypothetical protein
MFDPIEYADERMDSKQENELLKWLRQLDDEQKFTFVWRVLSANAWKGCELAKRSQLKPIFLEVILEKGLELRSLVKIRCCNLILICQ